MSDTYRWYYGADRRYICMHRPEDKPPEWMLSAIHAAIYYYDGPGYPGICVEPGDHEGAATLYPPVPGRDFVPVCGEAGHAL